MKQNRISTALVAVLLVVLLGAPCQTEEYTVQAGERAAQEQTEEVTRQVRNLEPAAQTNEALLLYSSSPADLVRVLAENEGGYRTLAGISWSADPETGEIAAATVSEYAYEADGLPFAVGTRIVESPGKETEETYVRVQEFTADEEGRVTDVMTYEASVDEANLIQLGEMKALPEDAWLTGKLSIAYADDGKPSGNGEGVCSYDSGGRLAEVGGENRIWQISYDSSGRLSEMVRMEDGREKNRTVFERNDKDLVVCCRFSGDGENEGAPDRCEFSYDENDRIERAEFFAGESEKPSETIRWQTAALEEDETPADGYIRDASYRNGLLQKIRVVRLENGRNAEVWTGSFIGEEKVDEKYTDYRSLEDEKGSGTARRERQMAFGAWLKEIGYTDGGVAFKEETITRWSGSEANAPVQFEINVSGPLHWYVPSAFSDFSGITVDSEYGTAAFGDPGAGLGIDLTGTGRYYILTEDDGRQMIKTYTEAYQEEDDSVTIRETGGEELLDISSVAAEYTMDGEISRQILEAAKKAAEDERALLEGRTQEPAPETAESSETHAGFTGTPSKGGSAAPSSGKPSGTGSGVTGTPSSGGGSASSGKSAGAGSGTGSGSGSGFSGTPSSGGGSAASSEKPKESGGQSSGSSGGSGSAPAPAASEKKEEAKSSGTPQVPANAIPIASVSSYPEADRAVDAFFTAMSGIDSGKISSYCSSQGIPDPGFQGQINGMLSKAPQENRARLEKLAHWGAGYTHRITGTKTEDGKTTVSVEVSAYDLGGLMDSCITELMSKALKKYGLNVGSAPKADLINMFLDVVEARQGGCGRTTATVHVVCMQKDGKWVVLNPDQVISAVKGNFNAVLDVWNRFG